ncbi:conserved Plasmodium protein, unknown function [Plasmodium ovale wallikeri]|uniref:Uncharacterized protein n=2 Tax=Plasmodium ovale TaxID=36330 RepID=A0A1A8ZHL3_PLAOA|nr:conserved Plasmodium protein, unknown function [Plasmodium ovale wallikeri]SBT43843.1 conserved Plasmodium protein, unknown function [Plasmodium ovale wallikeri]SBT78490.1 conserved Plasmodium protein, unknown function [Plasmodium ovale]
MSLESFDEVDFIKKHYNFKRSGGETKLDENEQDKVIHLLTVCKRKIEMGEGENVVEEADADRMLNYIKALKILAFYIPFNDSIKKKITEKKAYRNLFLGRNLHNNSMIQKEESGSAINLNRNQGNSHDTSRSKEALVLLHKEVDKYELLFLINLITHNDRNTEIFQYLYPFYFYYITLNEISKDNIFMFMNNFIVNEKTYEELTKFNDISFVLFLSLFDSLKKIKNETTICSYFYVFIENTLKNGNKLFLHILKNMRSLYTDFHYYNETMNENIRLFYKKNVIPNRWKFLNRTDNKNYILKYIAFMCRIIFEALYNILEGKNFEVENVTKYKDLYKIIIEQIKENLIFINEINYFDNFTDAHIDLYSKNMLFLDMFLYYKKKVHLEIFKLILFLSNIFSDRYEELDYLSSSEKKIFVDIIFSYLKTIHNMRNKHLSKKEEILYHKFVLNRYILSIVANFSADNSISNYIKKINGIDVLRKFMYIDDKDACLAEYSILAIKHIKENENLDEL